MTNILDHLVMYLAPKVDLVAGESAFYNELPDEPATCLVLQAEQTTYSIPAQIDATLHRVKITVRGETSEAAYDLAYKCWRWLLTDDEQYDEDRTADTTGFIQLEGGIVHVRLIGNPVWEKADQQGRKYYCFYALITTQR